MPHFLHPTSLELRNFKGIAELDIAFEESLTLLAGVNGAGKTSVIQALVASATHTRRLEPPFDYPVFRLPESGARTGAGGTSIVLGLSGGERSPLQARFSSRGRDLVYDGPRLWDRYRDAESPRGVLEDLEGNAVELTPPLPLVVYYEQNRIGSPGPDAHRPLVSSEDNRESSLNTTASSPSEFKAWFFEKEADEGRETRDRQDLEYEDPELTIIRRLLRRLGGFTAIRSRKPPNRSERTLLLEKEGVEVPFDSLSGGEQAFFLLVADLARRLMLSSPNTPVAEAPGIVCIDEIELHLHPAWQRRILKSLTEAFPSCQFIVSTHSPQVIAGVEARHVRLITPGENGVRKVSRPIASRGRDSNYVLEGILDVPARDDDVSRLFDRFDQLIDAGEMEEAERVLSELGQAVEGQSSGVAIRQAKWNRLRRAAT